MTELSTEQALAPLSNCGRGDRLSSITSRMSSAGEHVATTSSFRALKASWVSKSREAQRNSFVLEWNWNGQDSVYTIEQMSPKDYAAFLAEEQEE
jgi:hypothetical protein